MIGAFSGLRHAASDPHAVVALIADPAVRIVTLTVTEKGYRLDPVTGELIPGADLDADLGTDRPPETIPGLLTRGLAERCRAGAGPIAIVSCDNLPANGRRMRALVDQAVRRLPAGHPGKVARLGLRAGHLPRHHGGPDRAGHHRADPRRWPRRRSACGMRPRCARSRTTSG